MTDPKSIFNTSIFSLAFKMTKVGSSILLGTAITFSVLSSAASARPIPAKDSASTEAILQTAKAFRPPSNPRRRSGYRTTTGTRQGSCVDDAETAFTMLGPSETVGLTASTRPEFIWYLPPSEKTYPVQFRLLAPNAQGIPAPIHTAELNYTSGFTTYQLPAEAAALSHNQEYRWQVVVVCDPNYLSRSLNQERAFEVVTPSADLQQALATATTESQRALAYGEAGIWYDAISQVIQANSSQSQTVLQSLLKDLANTEENERLSENISKIVQTSFR